VEKRNNGYKKVYLFIAVILEKAYHKKTKIATIFTNLADYNGFLLVKLWLRRMK